VQATWKAGRIKKAFAVMHAPTEKAMLHIFITRRQSVLVNSNIPTALGNSITQ
jgi:hypothetical protein